MTAPTTRLGDVPVGRHVVLDGEVAEANGSDNPLTTAYCVLVGKQFPRKHRHLSPDTPVLLLDGDAPRPLRECEGLWWDPNPNYTRKIPARTTRIAGNTAWCEDADGRTSWTLHPAALVWPLAQPEPRADAPADADEARWTFAPAVPGTADPRLLFDGEPVATPDHGDDEPTLSALADHLNTSGPDGGPWVPVPPEPERLTFERVLLKWNGTGSVADALADHGYAVIDTRDPHVRVIRTDAPGVAALMQAGRVLRDPRGPHPPRPAG